MNLKGIAIAAHPPVIIPEIGGGKCLQVDQTIKGMKKTAREIARIKPDTIVCITPHGNLFRDGISVLYDQELKGDLGAFSPDPSVKEKTTICKKCDMTLLDNFHSRLHKNDCRSLYITPMIAEERGLNMQLDHGVLVPLYYINKVYANYKIVHITVSGLSLFEHYRMGRILREAIEVGDQRTVILSCSDLSHYHRKDEDYTPLSEVFDQQILQGIRDRNYYDLLTMDPTCYEPAGQCGLRPMIMALGAVDGIKTTSEIYAYEAPLGVGYMEAFIQYDLTSADPTNESLILRFERENQQAYAQRMAQADVVSGLALKAIDLWVREGRQLDADEYLREHADADLIEELQGCSGVFVTLKKNGELRGCMGTVHSVTENIAHEIVRNSIQAAAYDPRFLPVEAEELPMISTEVSILADFEDVTDFEDHDPKEYGLIAEKDLQMGLLLPDLPGIDTVEKQITAVKKKAGMTEFADDDVDRIYFTRFKTRIYRN